MVIVASVCASLMASFASDAAPAPGAVGGPGLALRAHKVLCLPFEGEQVVGDGIVLVRDGKIIAVGKASRVEIPDGFEVRDLGARWITPGLIDLHSHCGGDSDWNDAVHLVNTGLRVSAGAVPANPRLRMAVAGGVTTVLFIPGSATNVGGQGVLLKTGLERYEEARVRDPGSLKIAQAGNPERWRVWNPGRALQNWNTRANLREGADYARRWTEHDAHGAERPERRVDLDVFRDLEAKTTQVSVHTQIYQVVLTTLTMLRRELGFDVYFDHGELGGYRLAKLAADLGVPAIIGPREIEPEWGPMIAVVQNDPDGMRGTAAEYQKNGHPMIGFNTDSTYPEGGGPWAQDLALQAAMAARYGLDERDLASVRGMTIVPAKTAGIDERVGSLEDGKDADVVVWDGNPVDPRTSVEAVWIEGVCVYDTQREERRW